MMIEKPFPLNRNYTVSEDGRVFRRATGRPLQPCVLKRGGYLGVSLWENNKGKSWPVHQIVALTYHGERPTLKHHAAHEDGNKLNNHKDNISWKTKTENEADKVSHGTDNRGERNGSAKINAEIVSEIRRRLRDGFAISILAHAYGLKEAHIYSIKSGRIWRHVK